MAYQAAAPVGAFTAVLVPKTRALLAARH